jgi:hypothetical protein
MLRAMPLGVALLALTMTDHTLFRILTMLNLVCYLGLFLRDWRNLPALHLLLLSGVTLIAGFVKPVGTTPAVGFDSISPGKWLVISITAYGLYWIIRSRNPKTGVLGALAVALTTLCLAPNAEFGLELGIQAGLVLLLSHSLRWVDAEHQGAGAARIIACGIWFIHSLAAVHFGWTDGREIVFAAGGLLLVTSIFAKLLTGQWHPAVLPIASLLVLSITPAEYTTQKLQGAPAGFLAVAGSFLLFGLGTVAALTKSRWHPAIENSPAATETETGGGL